LEAATVHSGGTPDLALGRRGVCRSAQAIERGAADDQVKIGPVQRTVGGRAAGSWATLGHDRPAAVATDEKLKLASSERSGKLLACLRRMISEAEWLLNYTAEWPRLDQQLAATDPSLEKRESGFRPATDAGRVLGCRF
jgi:hypothetical protein